MTTFPNRLPSHFTLGFHTQAMQASLGRFEGRVTMREHSELEPAAPLSPAALSTTEYI